MKYQSWIILALSFAASAAIFAADQPRIKLATILPRGTSTHQAILQTAAKWRDAGVNTTIYTDGVMAAKPRAYAACGSTSCRARCSPSRT